MSNDINVELSSQVDAIRGALDLAGERISERVPAQAHADLEQVVRRLELGVHHTVIALVGGTGSGKSSTFNALTRLNFADVGVIRPTTSQASACTWHTNADPLLDFLGVSQKRRISRESALTQDDEKAFSGLVLLDLPDHDSINEENANLADRLLPMIVLLIWVVDPQKYADNVLHEKYLQELTDREDAMVVVVNQVDTVPDSGLDSLRTDVKRLLAEDNLHNVPVLLASAKTGHGMGIIRSHIEQMIAQESIAARTARDELNAIFRRIREDLAAQTPSIPPTVNVTAELANAAGVPAVGESIRVAVSGAGSAALTSIQPPATSRIEAIRESWVEQTGEGMPRLWREHLGQVVQGRQEFYSHVEGALSGAKVPSPVDTRAKIIRFLGVALVIIGIITAAIGAVLDLNLALMGTGGGLVIVGVGTMIAARVMRRKTAVERSQNYLNNITLALATVVHEDLEAPAKAALEDHEQVLRATDPLSTSP